MTTNENTSQATQDLWQAIAANDHWGLSHALSQRPDLDTQKQVTPIPIITGKKLGIVKDMRNATDREGTDEISDAAIVTSGLATPLQAVIQSGDMEAFFTILNSNTNIEATSAFGLTAMHWAAAYGTPMHIMTLVNKNADINARSNPTGYTPIFYASQQNISALDCLLSLGADVNAETHDGDTALHICTLPEAPSKAASIESLLAYGASPNHRNNDGFTPFHNAIMTNDINAVQQMLKYGADATMDNTHAANPAPVPLLLMGILTQNPAMVTLLTDNGADVNDRIGPHKTTLLHIVATAPIANKADMITALLDVGARTDIRNADGQTALEEAEEKQVSPEIISKIGIRSALNLSPTIWRNKRQDNKPGYKPEL